MLISSGEKGRISRRESSAFSYPLNDLTKKKISRIPVQNCVRAGNTCSQSIARYRDKVSLPSKQQKEKGNEEK